MAARKPRIDRKAAEQLSDSLTRLPDSYLACRDMKHAWEVTNDYHVVDEMKGGRKVVDIRRVLACARCVDENTGLPTQRVERYIFTAWGLEKVGQAYIYPSNYQLHGQPRGVKPSSLIYGEQYRRTLEKVASDAKVTSISTKKKQAG